VVFKYARTKQTIDWAVGDNDRQLPMRSYQFDGVIDLMLAEPGLSLAEIGKRLGKSPAWMTYVTKSDAFRDIYEERRREKNEAVHEELNQALTKVAKQGLDILSTRMEKNPNSVGIQQALDVADKALERLGYGVKLPGTLIDARSQMQVVLSEADFMRAQAVVRGLEKENALTAPQVLVPPPDDLADLLAKSGFDGRGEGEAAGDVSRHSWSGATRSDHSSTGVASREEAEDGGEEEWTSLSEEN
jgi:hypothetical protein